MIEQVLWLLGNIAGDSTEFRDRILQHTDILEAFNLYLQQKKVSKVFLRTMCWLNSNLAKGLKLDGQSFHTFLSVSNAGMFTEDPDMLNDCLWTVASITDTHHDEVID